MKKFAGISVFAIALSAGLAAQGQAPSQPPAQPSSSPQSPRPTGSAGMSQGTLASTDTSFITTAGASGKAEVALATLAQQKASNDRVRQYATKLHGDHQKANSELTALAAKKKVTIPDIPADKKAVHDRLSGQSGAEFDRAYMTQMVQDHKASVSLFTTASSSSDADVKAFAEKTLPTLKIHLSDAEAILKELGSR